MVMRELVLPEEYHVDPGPERFQNTTCTFALVAMLLRMFCDPSSHPKFQNNMEKPH